MTQQEQIRKEQEAQIAAPRKPYQGLVQSISNIFHPLLVLTITALIICNYTPLVALPFKAKAYFVGFVFFYTLVMPALVITLLHVTHIIGHWALRDRRDRMLPFFTNFICYMVCALFLTQSMHYLPLWVLMPYYGSVILTFVAWIVSWKWKISAHAAANAAAMTYYLMLYFFFPETMPLWIPIAYILIVGMVCSTRVYLGRHTLGQVGAGVLLGICSILLANAIVL